MRLHVAGDTDVLIRRIGDHTEGIIADPALDEVVTGRILDLAGNQRSQ